jgi:GWxTD domain-containing protein
MTMSTRLFGMMMLFAAPAVAQMPMRSSSPDQPPPFLFYEAVNLVARDPAKSRIDIHYRIDREFFVAQRNTETTSGPPFRRLGEIAIEVADSTETVVARELDRLEIPEDASDRLPEQKEWYQGVFSCEVAPGPYTFVIEVTDVQSKRNMVDRRRTIRALPFGRQQAQLSTPLFVAPAARMTASKTLVPVNFGGDLLFGQPASLYVEFAPPTASDTTVRVRTTITTLEPGGPASGSVRTDSTAALPLRRRFDIVPGMENGSPVYSVVDSLSRDVAAVVIPLPAEQMLLRTFKLSLFITCGTRTYETTKDFRTVWPDMPFSMKDVDYALDALRYITSERELDSLKSGNFETRRNNLEGFWKVRDKTPATAYNELMTEYYRRVDHAVRTYGTLRLPDGSRSDRGRVYILYGPPARTDRSLDPKSGFQEIWYYDRLNRKFTFRDEARNGNYVLVSTTPS